MEGGVHSAGAFEHRHLEPHGQREAGIGSAPAGTTHITLDNGDIERGIASFEFDGGPQARVAAADDGDVDSKIALKRRDAGGMIGG